ncbi:hypothetical protein D3C72_1434690 [compost metagenome]
MPPGLSTRSDCSKVACVPSASIEASTPRPPVSFMTSSTTSQLRKFRTTSAPILRAISSRWSLPSMAMMVVAPHSRAPAVAHSPIGPCANTATVSPMRILAFSAPLKPVDMMSGHISTCSSVRPSGIGARLAWASGTSTYSAWVPSIMLPKRQPAVAL